MAYEPLHHKYRPQSLAQLVGQEAIAQTLTNAINTIRIAPAYLFTGPRGTGKTSSARILAKSLNCLTSEIPTAQPCGKCDVCLGITQGRTLDVIEIDAASNTGVDNIRDLIEKAQFAPAQCRYKVYVIDECLTGDSLVETDAGLMRIDDPQIEGQKVLSYNETTTEWEYKNVVRWLDQGEREIFVIKTNNSQIRCTGNHLFRTENGWVEAKNLQSGMNILSPVNLPTIVSVQAAGLANVYDIEVADNHNFVANGLLVHNCHMLSVAAFNSLLKTLEEPPEHVVFVLATTDPQRVLPTIISRCQRFDFRRIPLEAMVKHLRYIADQEQINITDESIYLVAQIAQGGLRDAESLLDQLSLLPDQIGAEQVWDLVGTVPEKDLVSLLEAIADDQPTQLLERTRHIMDRGREPLIVLQNLAGFYRDLLIAKTAPNRSNLVALTKPTWEYLCKFVQDYDLDILAGQKHLQESEVQIKNTTQPRLWLEVTLLGLLPSAIRQKLTVIAPPAPNNIPSNPVHTKQERSPNPLPFDSSPTNYQINNLVSNNNNNLVGNNNDNLVNNNSVNNNSVNNNSVNNNSVNNNLVNNNSVDSPNPTPSPIYPLNTSTNLADIWEQVLSQIQPNATQQLYRQQVSLLTLEDDVATVAVRSKPIHNLVSTKITNLEKAFQVLFQKTIKVRLQIIDLSKNHINNSQNSHNSHIYNNSDNSQNSHNSDNSRNSNNSNNSLPEDLINNNGCKGNFTDSIPGTASDEKPANIPIIPDNLLVLDQQKVAIASQKIAELFSGEIISMNPEFYLTTGGTENNINSGNINSGNISKNLKSDGQEEVNDEQLDMDNFRIKLTELTTTLEETDFIADDLQDLNNDIEF